jgi:hypothetical protein
MRARWMSALLTASAVTILAGAAPAFAQSPWWHVSSNLRPSHLQPAGENTIVVTVSNLGDSDTSGEASILDRLPTGLKAISVSGLSGAGGTLNCPTPTELSKGAPLSCALTGALPPYEQVELRIAVEVLNGATTGELNEATITGGGAPSVSITRPITIGGEPTFGIEDYELANEEEGGAPDTQAGSHPFQQTTTLTLDQTGGTRPTSVGLVKDLSFRWPPGLIGNPTPIPRCTLAQFGTLVQEKGAKVNACPPQTAVGVAAVLIDEPKIVGILHEVVPLFNLEPGPGEPARLGFYVPGGNVPVLVDPTVRSGEDYGVTIGVHNVSQDAGFLSSEVTVWGVPGEASHDSVRGWGCLAARGGGQHLLPCTPLEDAHPTSFLSVPSSCTGPLESIVEGDSWAQPGAFTEPIVAQLPALHGCNRLPFSPSIRLTPDQTAASSPTGLGVDVHVPQEESLNASGLAEADPRDITVAFPEGVAVNPAGGDGLQACPEGLVGFTGFNEQLAPGSRTATFTGKLPEPFEPGVNFCGNASKIGTVTIRTPILPNPIEGDVYLASQNENPFGSLLAVYIVAEDPVSGVLVKLAGEVHLTETGQVVSTFENSPQAPFEDAEFHFFGGERAPMATPARCGAYTGTAAFTPWSSSEPVDSSSTFDITSGPNGSPCPGASLPFSPSLTAGPTSNDAASFSPLTTTIGRQDGQQNIQSVQLHMPAGLEGLLTTVKLCPEAQANEGTCGSESLIGETTVSAGVGSDPVSVKGGKVYITEKYQGAPFGLSIVNPVKAGPFDLEHDTSNPNQQPSCDCLVVRAKIEVDPRTADLTITTDPSGPHAIPHLIDGVPAQIKKVNVTINRDHFTFNGTSCNPLSLTGTITSDENASASLSVPFQLANCALLKFTPTVQASSPSNTSKADGVSLSVKVAYPTGALGSQAWVEETKFDIPKQFPARLTTLQKACLASVFEANPASCPPAALIGHVVVHTPVLPVPLAGPVYFVSYGGAKFPEAVFVLQGYGITVDLHGETFIDKKTGITSATFRNTPDVPFDNIEVTIPSGPNSEFAANLPTSANGSLCGQKLAIPTFFKAQNGLEIHQSTPIAITGCHARPTNAQRLATALKACHKRKNKAKRAACEAAAHRKYRSAKKTSTTRKSRSR